MQRDLNAAILVSVSLIGLAAFLYPFFLPQQGQGFDALAHTLDAPLLFAAVVILAHLPLFLLHSAILRSRKSRSGWFSSVVGSRRQSRSYMARAGSNSRRRASWLASRPRFRS